MLIKAILTARDTVILCVNGIIQDELLYCTECIIVNDDMLYRATNIVTYYYMF